MSSDQVDILIIEDDPEDLELAMLALRKSKLADKIAAVRDGEEALAFLFCQGEYAGRSFAHPPRLVLLDLKLPKVDGFEVLREVKRDPRTQSIPVVLLTSSTERNDLARGYGLGANSYIQKPVEFNKFQKLINEIGSYWLHVNRNPAN